MRKKKVLMIATSRRTRGGITEMLKIYEQLSCWHTYDIKWLETHIDKNAMLKLCYGLKAWLHFLCIVGKYDLMHIHIGELTSVRRKHIFFRIARMCRKKTVIHIHIGSQLASVAGHRLFRRMVRKAEGIVVLSDLIKQELMQYDLTDNCKISVIPNPCPLVENVRYSAANKEILFAGTLNHNKGYEVLMQAFAAVAHNHPDWTLVMAGSGETRKAHRLAEALHIERRIVMPGWICGQAKDACFRRASIYCLASYAEGFPISVLEALAYGLPIVSTPVGSLREALADNATAVLFTPGDHVELAAKLNLLMNDDDRLNRLSQASRGLAERYSSHATDRLISKLYEDILQRR